VTLVIPHPTTDDLAKCVTCKTAVAQHKYGDAQKSCRGKKIRTRLLYRMHDCRGVAEAVVDKYIDNPLSCACPAARHRGCLDCSLW
jgi:hypothetical protein